LKKMRIFCKLLDLNAFLVKIKAILVRND